MTLPVCSGGLTIVVPAANEADRLASTVKEIAEVAGQVCDDYEIIVIDDGSRDGTPEIADRLAAEMAQVRIIHFEKNRGVGAGFQAGLRAATFGKISLVPGDNAFTKEALWNVFSAARQADMVISYRDMHPRTPTRRLLSTICTRLMRIAIGARIRDAHGLYVWPVANARAVVAPQDYRYHLLTLAGLFRQNLGYVEVPAPLNPRPDANSGVMRLSVVMKLGFAVLGLIIERLMMNLSVVEIADRRRRE